MTMTAAAVLVPLAVACGNEGAGSGSVGPQQPVTGVEWRVDSLTTESTTLRAPAGARLRVEEDGTAGGNLGCNSFGTRATLREDRISFGALRTTKIACDRPRMTFERALAAALDRQTLTARTEDGKLTLTGGHGERVRLTRIAAD
ncbi:META domain-containing protein [Streptomyces sp. LaPpAH-108]|uniref:META domain-containing protein n=1 Tax=Streptomyces sp. LaPpAH-108 TaxID=1155714 RepID=UPI001F2EC740|nr:META domain-containing protein [Streptomyces sp. LaPpAH-108]